MEGPFLEIVVFEVGGQQYGLPASDVRELQRAATLTPLPRAPAIVEGVVNLRGAVVPVLDIRSRFRLPPKPMEPTDHFVVARAGERLVALRVDRATDLIRVAAADVEEARRRAGRGIRRLGGQAAAQPCAHPRPPHLPVARRGGRTRRGAARRPGRGFAVTWTHPAFEAVADLLARRTGLVFGPNRRDGAEAGMRRAMGRAGVREPERYRDLLEADADALDDLVVELTVGETYFFREPAQFQFLRREVLPDLWRRHGPGTPVRAWSAACASGEEAYSLAILLQEEGAGSQSQVLATDISRAALAKARRAVYGAWSLRGEGAAAAAPYLRPDGVRFVLDDRIRRRVRFEYLNLALDVYPSLVTDVWGMHIIFCRNVLIYFNPETIAAVARRLYETLAPGGWLLTAASDPPLAAHARFETVTTDAGVLYRRVTDVPWRAGGVSPLIPHPVGDSIPDQGADAPRSPPAGRTHLRRASAPRRPSTRPSATEPLAEARKALAEGDYERAAEYTRDRPDDAAACLLHVRALANLDAARGEQACAAAAARHPLSTELQYLHGVLLATPRPRRRGRPGGAAGLVPRPILGRRPFHARLNPGAPGRRRRGAAGLPQRPRPVPDAAGR